MSARAENASGRTAATSRASIAPTEDATTGAPASPARSITSLVATTQSNTLRRSSWASEPLNPGRHGATTRNPSAASASRNGCSGGVPTMPWR